MTIEDLREIGKRLLRMVPRYRSVEESRIALKKGASGDKTFTVDKRAEEVIFSSLESLNEPLQIISEEFGIKDIGGAKGLRVVVDPIDGSKNAVTGIPLFSTSIAAAQGNTIGDIFLGYVINLISGDEFWAERGEGAFFNGVRIETQKTDECKMILYETRTPKNDIAKIMPLLTMFHRTRCLGSTALDLSYLALGSASAFVSPTPSRSFDFAGGWLLVKEAGGVFTDITGRPVEDVETGLGRSAPLLVSANDKLYRKLLKALAS